MVFIGLYDDPLPSMKPCLGLQPYRCFGKETNMDNTDGNLPTYVSKVSKSFIFRYENPKFFMIIELACGSHENLSSPNSKMLH
jgi:hypothetical protein